MRMTVLLLVNLGGLQKRALERKEEEEEGERERRLLLFPTTKDDRKQSVKDLDAAAADASAGHAMPPHPPHNIQRSFFYSHERTLRSKSGCLLVLGHTSAVSNMA